MAMSTCISSLGTSKLAEKMRPSLKQRFNERRGIFSDVSWHLQNMEAVVPADSNLFFTKPGENDIPKYLRKILMRS